MIQIPSGVQTSQLKQARALIVVALIQGIEFRNDSPFDVARLDSKHCKATQGRRLNLQTLIKVSTSKVSEEISNQFGDVGWDAKSRRV